MKKIKISGKNDYTVYIKNNAFLDVSYLLESYHYENVIAIIDRNINASFYEQLAKSIKIEFIEVSEEVKNITKADEIISIFEKNNVYRKKTLVLAVGGGVLLDLVGFVSSVYMRGIDIGYVPTTLLAMVDASVGSKNALHLHGKKNIIGTLYDPKFVIVDSKFLGTLDGREIRSGIAEIIKISYLLNPKVLKLLDGIYEYNFNWDNLLYYCISMKNQILEKDFNELHVRKYLNFGHTFGHAIESYYDFKKYTHGEAVAIGMVLAYPTKELILHLKKYGLPTCLDEDVNYKEIYNLMKSDKKNSNDYTVQYITLKDKCIPTIDNLNDEFELFSRIQRVRLLHNEIL